MFCEPSIQHMVVSYKNDYVFRTFEATRVVQSQILNSHIGAAEYSSLQRCYAESIGKWFPRFEGSQYLQNYRNKAMDNYG